MKTNKMINNKFIKVAGIFAFLFMFGFSYALTNPVNGIMDSKKIIKQHITFPNIIFSTSNTEKVEVVFKTSESGKINFVLAKTDNEFLKNKIEKQFFELTLSKAKNNFAYSLVFNIKKI